LQYIDSWYRPSQAVILEMEIKCCMTNIRTLYAENLKKYRHAVGLSQAKLAERVDSSTYYIGMMKIQRKFPSP